MIVRSAAGFILASLLVAGCGDGRAPAPPAPPADRTGTAARAAKPVLPDSAPTIVFLGTSLTAGYGLPDVSLAYPAVIQRKLDSAGFRYRVVNAGISGETSAGALRRIDWVLNQGRIALLAVETGANDGLRGQDPDSLRANLQAIFDRAKRLDPPPKLMVIGMEAMPNLGSRYTKAFRTIYPEIARANGAALVPFLLAGVAGVDSLNQADGIHPTPAGHRIVAATVWPVLKDALTGTK